MSDQTPTPPTSPTPKSRFDPPTITSEPDMVIDGRRIHLVWNGPTLSGAQKTEDEYGNVQLTARIVNPDIPKGVLIHHAHPKTGEACVSWLPWARDPEDPEQERWTLLSLRPLSIAEPFVCTRCGEVGGIREGRWWVGAGGT